MQTIVKPATQTQIRKTIPFNRTVAVQVCQRLVERNPALAQRILAATFANNK